MGTRVVRTPPTLDGVALLGREWGEGPSLGSTLVPAALPPVRSRTPDAGGAA